MTTKEYLGQIKKLSLIISNKTYEIKKLRHMMVGLKSPAFDEKVDASLEADKMGSLFAVLDEEEKKIEDATKNFVLMRKHIIDQLEGMDNVEYYNVLYGRFVKEQSFGRIGKETHYTKQRCFQICEEAMDDFEKLYGEEYLRA